MNDVKINKADLSPEWNRSSWRNYKVIHNPVWPDEALCKDILYQLTQLPALVFAGETRKLKRELAEVMDGKSFVLQAGDCSENFSFCNGPRIHDLLKVILRMALILAYSGEKKIVKIGRMAGQYAKPRSSDVEIISDLEIPIFRGEMINSPEPTIEARTPDPRRMLEGYFRSAATLNLVRAFTRGGYASLDKVNNWSDTSFGSFPDNPKYNEVVKGMKKTINFYKVIGLDTESPQMKETTVYTSHEALLLEFEEVMTRIDTTTGDWYDTSAHMLWIGDRTRQPGGAHVEFLRGVCNPIGVKVGPDFKLDDIKRLVEILNPQNEPGRLSLITRLGADKINSLLPSLLEELQNEGFKVIWVCDPMHGNTYKVDSSRKTRRLEDILDEIHSFFLLHKQIGTIAGGVHLELTGDNVTECVGGKIFDKDLNNNYQTNCDPRLNAEQSIELAFEIAEILRV